MAGLNAGLAARGLESWCPRRDEAYIGVLIDDLITLGTNEPYRMFTSRAEYRLTLREDNADLRLTEHGRKLGLVDDERWEFYSEKKIRIEEELQFLRRTWVQPNTDRAERINRLLEKPISREYSLADLLARPRVEHGPLLAAYNGEPDSSDGKAYKAQTGIEAQSTQQADIQIKYQGYIDRQEEDIERLKKQENTKLPADFNYQQMQGLSNELKQKLLEAKPENIGRASRIPGITPAAISLLLIYLKKHRSVNRKAG